MDWKHFNVHYKYPDGTKGKQCVTALNKDDAKNGFINHAREHSFPNGTEILKVIGPLGNQKMTPKRMFAHQYRSCMGAACMLEANLRRVFYPFTNQQTLDMDKIAKWSNAKALTNKQVAKVKRDIADMFKLMGLKIKHHG